MNNLKILTLQSSIVWENKEKNRSHFFALADEKATDADVVIFPEMFSTGFSMNTKLAETMTGKTISLLKDFSAKTHTLILTSLIIEENKKFYNRLVAVFPDGKISYYNKRHLFSFAGENNFYSAGQEQLLVEWQGWTIMPLVCYDLRFPVWSRNTMDYDLLVYVANWPERRRFAWQSLLIARAIENQCFVAGVNRIGEDNNTVTHSGDTMVLNPFGEKISQTKPFEENAELVTLHYQELTGFRQKFNFLADRDFFRIGK